MKFLKTVLDFKKTAIDVDVLKLSMVNNSYILFFASPLGLNYICLNSPAVVNGLEFIVFNNVSIARNSALKRIILLSVRAGEIGFFTELCLVGLGFRAKMNEAGYLMLNLGHSHAFAILVPKSISVLVNKDRILVFSSDQLLLGNFVYRILRLRRPDPYKGKGVVVANKRPVLKEGKKQKT